jgi:hypothetical protein
VLPQRALGRGAVGVVGQVAKVRTHGDPFHGMIAGNQQNEINNATRESRDRNLPKARCESADS